MDMLMTLACAAYPIILSRKEHDATADENKNPGALAGALLLD
jgi:hypothetical protein